MHDTISAEGASPTQTTSQSPVVAHPLTPLMKQYTELKATVPDCLLFFRMGDFYELFGDDAVEASRILELTLTTRDRGKPNATPMAGMPHHSSQVYIQRLLKAGKKVAIGEQMEDPATVAQGKIVRREIIRVLTPAVQFEAEQSDPQWLAIVVPSLPTARGSGNSVKWTLALLDASTGESRVETVGKCEELCDLLSHLSVRHILRWGDLPASAKPFLELLDQYKNNSILVEPLPTNTLTLSLAERILREQLEIENLEVFLPEPEGRLALGLLVHYVLKSQRLERLLHLARPRRIRESNTHLLLGPHTALHLDLLPKSDGSPSLFQFINQTKTAAGARLLRQWMLAPLRNLEEILNRQGLIQFLSKLSRSKQETLRGLLSQIYDLERLVGRVSTRLANPRDLLSLGTSLHAANSILDWLSQLELHSSPALLALATELKETLGQLQPLVKKVTQSLREDVPLVSRDGGIFRPGTSSELDRLLELTTRGEAWLLEFEARERAATGINSLKVKYNRVFGYYLEITTAHLEKVPAHYQRKQTMVGAERFFTEELKKFEEESVHAGAKQKALEAQLFEELLESVALQMRTIAQAAGSLAVLDAAQALSLLANERDWVFPTLDDSLDLKVTHGRHPLITGATPGSIVPNSAQFSERSGRLLLITGPNMGGKSTVMRQIALMVVLGQMGAPVPAASAHWGVVHSLYTRIGAQDAISRGQSTFMVEMSELAHILQNANQHSLLILDEIGRGTSTYDGMSVAWATLEWLSEKVKARTLFATHYHELTALEGQLAGLRNCHLAVEVSEKGVLRFLYELREGPASESFGIHVAKIAGLPTSLIKRSWGVLKELEASAPQLHRTTQLSLFSMAGHGLSTADLEESSLAEPEISSKPSARELLAQSLLEDLEKQSPTQMTPLQSLLWLDQWKQKIEESLLRETSKEA